MGVECLECFCTIFEHALDAVLLTDDNGRCVDVNPAAARLTGYSREELLQRSVWDVMPRDNAQRLWSEFLAQGMAAGKHAIQRKDGSRVEVEYRAVAQVLPGVNLCALRDVTAREGADEALRESEDRYRDLVEHSRDLICTHDLDGQLLSLNKTPAEILGYERDELVGRNLREFLLPEYHNEFEEYLARVKQDGAARGLFCVLTRSGEKRIWEYNNTLRTTGVAEPVVRGMAHDITERWRAEKALRESEDKFAKAFRLSPDPMVISTLAEGRYLDVNDSFLQMTGYSRAELVGQTCFDLNIWVDPTQRTQLLDVLQRNGTVTDLNIRFRTKSGEIRTVLDSAQTIELGADACILAVMRDVTEQRALEEQLRQSQKMEAIALLAGGIAHDFNNLLTGILGYGQLLQQSLSSNDALLPRADEIVRAAIQGRCLTEQLLALSRRQAAQPRILDLNLVVSDMAALLQRLIGEDIELVTDLGKDLGAVEADPGQVGQVVMNLVVNARDAMPAGGKLTIETRNLDLRVDDAPQPPGVKQSRYVVLVVRDTGCGMHEATRERIFEAFFSTKPLGKGTGLGLSIVHGIVTQSGGYIAIDSAIDQGTRVSIYLPRIEGTPVLSTTAPLDTKLPMGGETILLVEDSEVARELTAELLEQSGYCVLKATSGTHAARISKEHPEPIHLLLTDIVMPGISGPELVRRLLALRPEMKILYMTGYASERVFDASPSESVKPPLKKPFLQHELLLKVRQVLDGDDLSKQLHSARSVFLQED